MRSLVPLVLVLALSVQAAPRVDVPRIATTPRVDGSIGTKEWKDAIRVPLGGGGQAMLQHNGTYLFIALVGRRNGIGTLCTLKNGEVHVLHASAALGTAVFKPEGNKWISTRPFVWTNRDTGPGEEAQAERKKFLDAEGWFANARPDGSPGREYQIRIDRRGEIPLTLGFMGFVKKGEFELATWPDNLADGCGDLDLGSGYTDRDYPFDPKTWGVAAIR